MWQRKKRYANLDQVENTKSMQELLKWRKERRSKVKDLSSPIPVVSEPELVFLQANRSETSITWIGHSTFLIQIAGCNLLIDPVWARKMGMEKRLSPPGLRLEDLPPIDVILISHGHYDHLHFPTLRQLQEVFRQDKEIRYLVPEGLGSLFRKKSIVQVQEFGWWEQLAIGDVCFHFVPAQHWSRRTLFDLNRAHWGGWIIQSKETTIYFAGDSGYFRGL